MTLSEILADQIGATRDWTLKLIADLSGDDWHFAPGAGLAHPLWICGHLTCAQHLLIHVRTLGGGVLDDEFVDHFPIGGPVNSVREHDYPSTDVVLKRMSEVHKKTLDAIGGMSDELLSQPATGAGGQPHPHYTDKLGAVSHCGRHEAFHAGQLATIRRLLGKPFLR